MFFSRTRKRMKVTNNVVQQLLTCNLKVMKIRREQQRFLLYFQKFLENLRDRVRDNDV